VPFARRWRIEYRVHLGAQKGLVGRVVREPAQRRRKRADHEQVVFEPPDEKLARGAGVARQRGIADEVAAFAALARAMRLGGGRACPSCGNGGNE
jgi:hypothetical protein